MRRAERSGRAPLGICAALGVRAARSVRAAVALGARAAETLWGTFSGRGRRRTRTLVLAMAALAVLAGDPGVRELRAEDGALRMKLLARGQAGEINSQLVAAGLVVSRLEPAHRSLEDRFLEMTTRLEVAA